MSNPDQPDDSQDKPRHGLPKFLGDPSEKKAAELLARERKKATGADAVEHTVWSEPALSVDLAGTPGEDQLTYPGWLTEKIRGTSFLKGWWVTLVIALAAGPWGVLGAISGSGSSSFGVLMVAVFGPVAEEITKVAAALWIVEKRPFLFRSFGQILICAACGGLAFAANSAGNTSIPALLTTDVAVPVPRQITQARSAILRTPRLKESSGAVFGVSPHAANGMRHSQDQPSGVIAAL